MDPRRDFDDETLARAARTARLALDAGRRERLGPLLAATYELIDTLDAVALGDTPPATAFDPRWE